jgi:hypothetical protein
VAVRRFALSALALTVAATLTACAASGRMMNSSRAAWSSAPERSISAHLRASTSADRSLRATQEDVASVRGRAGASRTPTRDDRHSGSYSAC